MKVFFKEFKREWNLLLLVDFSERKVLLRHWDLRENSKPRESLCLRFYIPLLFCIADKILHWLKIRCYSWHKKYATLEKSRAAFKYLLYALKGASILLLNVFYFCTNRSNLNYWKAILWSKIGVLWDVITYLKSAVTLFTRQAGNFLNQKLSI